MGGFETSFQPPIDDSMLSHFEEDYIFQESRKKRGKQIHECIIGFIGGLMVLRFTVLTSALSIYFNF